MKNKTLSHMFNVGIAQHLGVNEAIFLGNLSFWIKKNQANDKNYHDGYYWTFNSRRAYHELFPYWSEQSIRTIIRKLEKKQINGYKNYPIKQDEFSGWENEQVWID